MMILKIAEIDKLFNVATDKQKVIYPPDQVFVRPDFEFLLTIGGDLVTDENEYDKLIALLSRIGETEFYIRENIGATITERDEPFQRTIKLSDSYNDFQEKVRAFEPPMGWVIHHFFIYGRSENWGIYICEYPTINIIGCDRKLLDDFRQVFSINGNGYESLKEFIGQEYQTRANQMKDLITHYKLEN